MAEYSLIPADVEKIETKHRTIKTKIPVPESIPLFKELLRAEPRSMMGKPLDRLDLRCIGDQCRAWTAGDQGGT